MTRHLAGQVRHRVLHLERLLHESRQLEQALDVLAPVLGQQRAPATAQPEGEEIAGHQGGGEGLGGGDPDLGAGVGVEGAGGLARQRGADHVRDAHDRGALGPGGLDRAQGVRGLSGLRERDDEGLRAHHRVAVAELGPDVDLGGDPGQALHHEAPDDGRVIGGAARDQDDSLNARDHVGIELHVGQHHRAPFELDAPPHGVGGGARLLEDLLQHEMSVTPLLGHDRVPQDAARRPQHRGAVEVGDLDPGAGDDRDVPVLQHHHVAGVGEDGRDVGGEEGLVLAEPHHHAARAELGRDQPVGHAPVEDDHRVGAAQLAERAADRLVEPRGVLEMPLHQVGDDLGVGLRLEDVPLGLQALLDRQVVLDDAVVHHDQLARAVGVGVCVLVGGASVGGPAGVTEADGAIDRALSENALQYLDAPGGPPDLEPLGPDHRRARRVVPAVLEALQALDHDVDRALVPDVADDSTHGPTPRAWPSCPCACARPIPRGFPGARGPPPASPAARSW